MKPVQERNQECLPPKKRDLSVTNSGTGTGVTFGGGAGGNAVGEDEVVSFQKSAPNSEAQGGAKTGEWLRAQPVAHYSGESPESLPAVPVDQYSMLYKVALPSVTYTPSTLHPVLSHISPAYTVHSPLLQHPGLPYPHPLGYAQIPHSSLQFVTSPYAVPYALPPGFVPGSLMSPTGSISQPHAVSHLVPYPPVVQEGVVSPPPQPQVAAHSFAKVPASGVPLMLSSEQASQQHIGSVLTGAELGSRGVPVFYHPQGVRAPTASSIHLASDREMNGRDKFDGSRDVLTDVTHSVKNLPHSTSSFSTQEDNQNKSLQMRRPEDRSSPCQRSTPDSDLEVQQVVGRLMSNVGRKEVSFAPLNLSQSTQRSKDVHGESAGGFSGRNVQSAQIVKDSQMNSFHQQPVSSGHAVVLANGQPMIIPLEYTAQHQSPTLQHNYPGPVNNESPNRSFKALDSFAKVCLPERSSGESNTAHKPPAQPITDLTQGQAPSAPSNPSHFMKGAIIQLATGELKRVEDLQTQDFVRSAELSGGLKIDSSMVVNIHASQQRPGLVSLHFTVGEQQSKVTIDVPPEHPFFVFGQGWSSCSPERTAQLYGLPSHHLQVGDVCVSITLQQLQQQQKLPQVYPQQQQQLQAFSSTLSKSQSTLGSAHQLMGPPVSLQPRGPSHFRLDRTHRERQREGDKDGLEKEDAVQFVGHIEPSVRSNRASAEHARSHSSYHLHTEGTAAGLGGANLRRWSSPSLQRYSVKGDDGLRSPVSTARPSFIPQEVKLSIEGRSNAGK
ncbi:ataxin-1-like [Eucyclogobius newberryi]|uniref:ataxin-1-like n=1 Tax=Eucyclogobius newberryi TaxID=166745 RepID=UPI003B58B66B